MLTLARTDTEGSSMKSPRIAEVASAVSRGAGLQMAEIALGKLRARRDAITEQLAPAYRDIFEQNAVVVLERNAIAALEEEKRTLEAEIRNSRIQVAELRLARSRKVAAALDHARLDASRRLLAATDQMSAAFQDLSDIFEQVRGAGDPDAPRHAAPQVGMIWAYAKRVVEAAEASSKNEGA